MFACFLTFMLWAMCLAGLEQLAELQILRFVVILRLLRILIK